MEKVIEGSRKQRVCQSNSTRLYVILCCVVFVVVQRIIFFHEYHPQLPSSSISHNLPKNLDPPTADLSESLVPATALVDDQTESPVGNPCQNPAVHHFMNMHAIVQFTIEHHLSNFMELDQTQ